jgi:hypothetical protein
VPNSEAYYDHMRQRDETTERRASPMHVASDHRAYATALRDRLPSLPERDRAFAQDLLRAYGSRRGASEKQLEWIKRLSQPPAPAEPRPTVQGLAKLVALFDRAATVLQRPAVTIEGSELDLRHNLRIQRAHADSRYPGQLFLRDTNPDLEARQYFGRVDRDGVFHAARTCPPEVLTYCEHLAADPATVGASHGHRTGMCCFCWRGLTDPRSTAVGYGPVCAERWGLPWGEPARGEPTRTAPAADANAETACL